MAADSAKPGRIRLLVLAVGCAFVGGWLAWRAAHPPTVSSDTGSLKIIRYDPAPAELAAPPAHIKRSDGAKQSDPGPEAIVTVRRSRDGAPVPNARVHVFDATRISAASALSAEQSLAVVTVDEMGVARWSVPPTLPSCYVVVNARGFKAWDSTFPIGPAKLSVDVRLDEQSSIEGTVVGANGVAVPTATVIARGIRSEIDVPDRDAAQRPGHMWSEAMTDARGQFSISVDDGVCLLDAVAEGQASGSESQGYQILGRRIRVDGEYVIARSGDRDVVLALCHLRFVRFRLVDGDLDGAPPLTKPHVAVPLSRASHGIITMQRADSQIVLAGQGWARAMPALSVADGCWAVRMAGGDPPPISLQVDIMVTGFEGGFVDLPLLGIADLRSDKQAIPVVAMHRGAPEGNGLLTIRVPVRTGGLFETAPQSLQLWLSKPGSDRSLYARAGVRLDDGRWQFPRMPVGEWNVRIGDGIGIGSPVPISLEAGGRSDATLALGAASGFILSVTSRDGTPLVHPTATWFPQGEPNGKLNVDIRFLRTIPIGATDTADPKNIGGVFVPMRPGNLDQVIRVEQVGYAPKFLRVTVPPTGFVRVEVQLDAE